MQPLNILHTWWVVWEADAERELAVQKICGAEGAIWLQCGSDSFYQPDREPCSKEGLLQESCFCRNFVPCFIQSLRGLSKEEVILAIIAFLS